MKDNIKSNIYNSMINKDLCTAKNKSGFTLIELMIVVAIIGILAAVAYPSYTDFVVRSNRAEALRELTRIANLQEQYYVDHRAYAANMALLGFTTSGGTTWFHTESGYYKIRVRGGGTFVATSAFELRARPKGAQLTRDSACDPIDLSSTGAKSQPACWE